MRLHRLRVAGEFDGVLHAEATATRGRSLTSWVFGDGAPSAGTAGVGGVVLSRAPVHTRKPVRYRSEQRCPAGTPGAVDPRPRSCGAESEVDEVGEVGGSVAEVAVPDLVDRELQAAGTRLNLTGALLAAAADALAAVGSRRHTR